MRFRTKEDEATYLALRTELYLAACQIADPKLVSLVMRNFGKLEDFVFREGVRQALACALMTQHAREVPRADPAWENGAGRLSHAGEETPTMLLAMIYGGSNTPLTAPETMWLDKMNVPKDARKHPWLDASPLKFPPMTYAEAMGVEQPAAPIYKIHSDHAPVPVPPEMPQKDPLEEPPQSSIDDELELLFQTSKPAGETGDSVERPIESPEAIEHLRSHIASLISDGWKPTSWPELVMKIGLTLGWDPFAIDLNLGSQAGTMMLTQLGIHMQPGGTVALLDFEGEHPLPRGTGFMQPSDQAMLALARALPPDDETLDRVPSAGVAGDIASDDE